MINFVQDGSSLTFTAPSGGVTSGAAYLFGGLLAVAAVTADEGASFSGAIEGVFSLAKKSGDTMSVGDLIYWDDSNSYFTTTDTGNYGCGTCAGAAGGSATTVSVKLHGVAVLVS